MDDIPDQPIFHRLPAIVDHGPIPSSTCSQRAERKVIPTPILEVITQLGLRYEPSGQADLQAQALRVSLLAGDWAGLNPLRLRHAAIRWAQNKPFMPKASELRAIVEHMESEDWKAENSTASLQIWCDERNAWAKSIGADWWYRVVTVDRDGTKIRQAEKLEGWRALEERAKAESRAAPEHYKGTDADIAAIHAYAARCVADGMTQAEFNTHVRRTGGCPRS